MVPLVTVSRPATAMASARAMELGVLELDARRHLLLAVVEDDFDALGLKLTDQLFCGFERGRILAGGHDVHLCRRDELPATPRRTLSS